MSHSILEHFSIIQDPRQQSKIEYELLDILLLCLVGMFCGADGWSEITLVGKARLSWFQERGFLLSGVPIADTIARTIGLINPKEFQSCFIRWMAAAKVATEGQIVAIDGKRVRGSYNNKKGHSAIHMVSAFVADNKLLLGQIKTEDKSNEITAIPALIELLEIKGCIVTIDAMGCQHAIVQKIRSKKADYVLAVKDNQKELHQDIQDFFACAKQHEFKNVPHDYIEEITKGHGRVETRKYWISSCLDTIGKKENWTGLKTIGMVQSERYINGVTTIESRHFIASIDQNANKFSNAVRSHWSIENQLHWVLDVSFNEDASRIRVNHGPENLSVARRMALNILRQDKSSKSSVKSRLYKAALDADYFKKMLDDVF